jgi:hypothetical protein
MYFEGDDALSIERTVQNIIMDYLRGKLNDTAGNYYALLGSKVLVTNSAETASEAYKQGNGIPFLFFLMPTYDDPYAVQDGNNNMIRRYEMQIPLDGSMSDHAAARTQPGKATDSDHKLMGAVRSIIELGFADLQALGLESPRIKSDTESPTSLARRNPYMIMCGVNTRTPI